MYSLNFEVKKEDSRDGILTIYNLIRMVLQTSENDSKSSEEYMKENQLVWILYSWHLKFNRDIKLGEKINIQTWASGFKKIKSSREFLVTIGGEDVVYCSAEFLILNYKTRKTVIVPQKVVEGYDLKDKKLLENKRVEQNQTNKISTTTVKQEDMDENNHVNNAIYIKWIEDIIYKEYGKKINEIKIIYSKEINTLINIDFNLSMDNSYYELKSNELHAKGNISFL